MFDDKDITIYEVVNSELTNEQIRSLWYDWFCKESSLVNKGKALLSRLRAISKTHRFDLKNTYVFFKNNCPVCGRLYDDFRICDIKTGDVIYTVIPKSGFDKDEGKSELYGRENNFQGPLVEGTWQQIKEYFLES